MALEAAGAGAYAATIPLSRPGAYIAVARDELNNEAVGTTGAVLTAGEELRPTGTDFALLGRIAEFTGGKRRDTLAGIFADRAARRFSYKDVTPVLLAMAALGLLFAVAARKLAIPDELLSWSRRLREAVRPQPAGHTADAPTKTPEAVLGTLLEARERGRTARGVPAPQGSPAIPAPGQAPVMGPGAMPAAAPRPAGLPPATAAVPRPAPAPAKTIPGSGQHPEGRSLTAAEILLARRKGGNRS
jgi:hypothetical protein